MTPPTLDYARKEKRRATASAFVAVVMLVLALVWIACLMVFSALDA